MSLVFSDCAYVVFERAKDAERFAVHAMRSFIRNAMPVRMGLSYGSFTNYEFKTGVLPNGHLMFAAPFMGTAVVDSYRAESSGIKGMRILVHSSFFMGAPDLDEFLVPLPKSEQRAEAVGELDWYELDLRLTLRRHIRRMKKSARAEAQIHYDKTLCFIRRMEEFRSWYSSCCRMERVANVVVPRAKEQHVVPAQLEAHQALQGTYRQPAVARWRSPGISDGRLYVRNQDTLKVYDIESPATPVRLHQDD
jgi:hypothetical protein